MIPTDTDGLLRDAGGARPASDVDALIERLQGFNPPDRTIASQRDCSQAIHDAADALVQLRDAEALARGKIAEQMIKIEWLERMKQNYYDEAVKGWSKCRAAEAEVARLNALPVRILQADLERLQARIANYQASRDWAIDTLAKALRVEADKTRAVEYYSRLAAERIAALEAENARLVVEFRKVGVLWKEAAIDASRMYDTIGGLENACRISLSRIAALEAERDCANDRAATHLADAYSMRDQRDALKQDAERTHERICQAIDCRNMGDHARGWGILRWWLVDVAGAAREKP
jgi:hypothetical protein